MVKISENDIKSSVINRLRYWEMEGVLLNFERVNCGKIEYYGRWIQLAKPGHSDIVAYILGKDGICWNYFIETKRPSNKLREYDQEIFRKKFERSKNCIYEYVTNPKQVDITIEKITGHTERKFKELDNIEIN